jgi:uncharacterized protein YdaU (DUF1376 family)
MSKDPAFLFYSKDWIEGTAEMLPEEKGVYIDLLAHQHQSGSLPVETIRLARIARLSHEEFLRIWEGGVKAKFKQVDNRLVNHKLTIVVAERSEKAHKNKIVGTFGGLLKKLKVDPSAASELRKAFEVGNFLTISSIDLSECLTEWIVKRIPSLGNGNANGDANTNKEVGGVGEEGDSNCGLVHEMFKIYKVVFPGYHADPERDRPACLQIAYKIGDSLNLTKYQVTGTPYGNEKVKLRWGEIAAAIASDSWYSKKSLSYVNNDWQQVVQFFNSYKNGSGKTYRKNGSHQPVITGTATGAGEL